MIEDKWIPSRIRHRFIEIEKQLTRLNERRDDALRELNSRPIGGDKALLRRINEIQTDINKFLTEQVQLLSKAICY